MTTEDSFEAMNREGLQQFEETYGMPMTMEPCWGWLGMATIINAINDAGSADREAIADCAGEKIDLAFVVLDPRQEEQFYWGFDWYMRHTDTKIVFPMHMWKQYEVQDRLIGMEVSEPYREKIMRIREKGQVFEL